MLRLRQYKSCDAEKIVSWLQDKDVFEKWGGSRFDGFPITAEQLDDKYMKNNGDCVEADNFYPMTACDGDEVIGHFIMRYLNGDPKILRFGWVVLDDKKRGKGYGKAMLKLGLTYAFEILQAEKVTIGVFANNPPAYHCYKSLGFNEVAGQTEDDNPRRVIELEITK